MRKYILGASVALAAVAGTAAAQELPSQPPAPIIPAQGGPTPPPPAVFPSGPGAPIVPLNGDPLMTGPGIPLDGGAPGYRFYAEGSFLLWFIESGRLPIPLATGGPSQGIVGRPGTVLVAGNSDVDYDGATPGFKVAVGGWLGETRLGIEANGMYLDSSVDRQVLTTGPNGVLARPYFDPLTRREASRIVVSPGAFSGGMNIENKAELYGFEVNPFYRAIQGNRVTVDLITGFRFAEWKETLTVIDTSRLLPGGVSAFNGFGLASPAQVTVQDAFRATNRFYGGNVGTRMSFGRGGLFLDLTGKVAIGGVTQEVEAIGTTSVRGGPFVSPATTAGGFLASGNALTRRTENRFAVLPEGDVKIGYQLTSWMNIFAGYSVLYFSSVGRPGDQISRTITLNQLPTSPTYNARGTGAPASTVVDDGLFVHGFNFGLTLLY